MTHFLKGTPCYIWNGLRQTLQIWNVGISW